MTKQQDIFVRRVKFKNLLPPIVKVIIKKKLRVNYIDLGQICKSSGSLH